MRQVKESCGSSRGKVLSHFICWTVPLTPRQRGAAVRRHNVPEVFFYAACLSLLMFVNLWSEGNVCGMIDKRDTSNKKISMCLSINFYVSVCKFVLSCSLTELTNTIPVHFVICLRFTLIR